MVDPSTSLKDIVKFTSMVQSVSVMGQADTSKTWTSMGFKQEAPSAGGVFGSDSFGGGAFSGLAGSSSGFGSAFASLSSKAASMKTAAPAETEMKDLTKS